LLLAGGRLLRRLRRRGSGWRGLAALDARRSAAAQTLRLNVSDDYSAADNQYG
jgi:hypothetical protein